MARAEMNIEMDGEDAQKLVAFAQDVSELLRGRAERPDWNIERVSVSWSVSETKGMRTERGIKNTVRRQ